MLFFRLIGPRDTITISVWNIKKAQKKEGAGFLGCVKIKTNAIHRLKDTGFQKLDLQKVSIEEDIDCSNVKGQIVISLAGRDRGGCGPNVTDVSLMSRSDMDGCCSQISPEIIPRNNSLPHGLVRVYQVRHCQCLQSHATLVYQQILFSTLWV